MFKIRLIPLKVEQYIYRAGNFCVGYPYSLAWSWFPKWTLLNFTKNLLDFLIWYIPTFSILWLAERKKKFLGFWLAVCFPQFMGHQIKINLICRITNDRNQAKNSISTIQELSSQLFLFLYGGRRLSIYKWRQLSILILIYIKLLNRMNTQKHGKKETQSI